jgi:hypothetical protein
VAWPGSVPQLLEEADVEERQLFLFYWDGFGPTSSIAGLVLIGNKRKRYLCFWDEIDSYKAVAMVDPWYDPQALQATVTRLIRRNGASFGTWLFGSLPTETTNRAPTLIPAATVKQAYFDLTQLWQQKDGDAWDMLAQEHYGRIVEPNSIQRSLDILSNWASAIDEDRIGRLLGQSQPTAKPCQTMHGNNCSTNGSPAPTWRSRTCRRNRRGRGFGRAPEPRGVPPVAGLGRLPERVVSERRT